MTSVINKTQRDFIINDSMISSILCDNGNEIIIMPINKKESFALLSEEYYKKYYINGELHFMNMENEEDVGMINKYIFKQAEQRKENVIGTKKELEIFDRRYNQILSFSIEHKDIKEKILYIESDLLNLEGIKEGLLKYESELKIYEKLNIECEKCESK